MASSQRMKISVLGSKPFRSHLLLPLLAMALSTPVHAQVFSASLLDAVALTLRQDPDVMASRLQIAANQGLLLSARAPFDPVWSVSLSQQKNVVPQPATGGLGLDSRQTTYTAGLSQLLASGVVISPSVSVNRLRDNAFNATAPSVGNVALAVLVPLRKGAGREVVGAPAAAAALALEASRSSFSHTRGLAVVRTVNAYWAVVASSSNLELASQAESRAGGLLASARKLAKADEIPNADLLKYEVRLVAQTADRLNAALQLSAALQGLSQALNIPLDSLGTAPHGLDPFPKVDTARLMLLDDQASVTRFLNRSTERRSDLRAAEQSLRAANTLADAARRNSGTQLDLSFSVGYNGLTEGSAGLATFRALGQPVGGANVGVALTYTLPGGDLERRGDILRREAAADQAQAALDALRLRASSEASAQLDALRTAIAQLDNASTQARLQATIFENEKRSYQAGLSTLLDLFTTESQLTAYQSGWVLAQRNFSQALVLFRFQTGSLLVPVAGDDGDLLASPLPADSLTTLPQELSQ